MYIYIHIYIYVYIYIYIYMYIYIISRSSPPNEFGVEIGFSPVIEWGKGKQE